jgi:hypothetical protein
MAAILRKFAVLALNRAREVLLLAQLDRVRLTDRNNEPASKGEHYRERTNPRAERHLDSSGARTCVALANESSWRGGWPPPYVC